MTSEHIAIQYHTTPMGELIIGAYNDELCLCDWRYRRMRPAIDKRIQEGLEATYTEASVPVITATIEQLTAYFNGQLREFDLPLKLVGTEFQQTVWQALQTIPLGSTKTYLGLSKRLGNPKAIRAVATANGANAISIIIPCHRIIGSQGEMVGYAGGVSAKQKLLHLEANILGQGQLELFA